ncbi:hypothetical protein PGT21_036847 [Puccinia graminis f. sp. tritici]|uniref:Uncharacterized protein n=1 Tax=Puccinia graminis f. sp. tritici TaxID=56615 RepID=A0A5B0R4X5_PUCGR|nr:hypothetical protein PGT21_036847 [Puccinia graminis f. sp. tritici]
MSKTRSHRPALVKAQDFKGAPWGRHSANVSPVVSSASSSSEAPAGILPQSAGGEGRRSEDRSSESCLNGSNQSPQGYEPEGIPYSVRELESGGGVPGLPDRTIVQGLLEERRDPNDSLPSPRDLNETTRGYSRTTDDQLIRSTSGRDESSSGRVLLPPGKSASSTAVLESTELSSDSSGLPVPSSGKLPISDEWPSSPSVGNRQTNHFPVQSKQK